MQRGGSLVPFSIAKGQGDCYVELMTAGIDLALALPIEQFYLSSDFIIPGHTAD